MHSNKLLHLDSQKLFHPKFRVEFNELKELMRLLEANG